MPALKVTASDKLFSINCAAYLTAASQIIYKLKDALIKFG